MSNDNGKLRVLQVHNQYAPGWGGEDTVVELEARLLRDRGHVVDEFMASSAGLKNGTILRQILAVPTILWSRQAYQALGQRISQFHPDIVHVHNTFPQLSPSVFWASRRAGVPVVQTLHNFRHVCANALLTRKGRQCEKCVGRSSLPALWHRCYAGSLARTAVMVALNSLHSKLGTYTGAVDAFITLNDVSREIFLRGDFPRHKLAVKPNFVPVSDLGHGARSPHVVFAGSISRHKGVGLLLEAWSRAAPEGFHLLLIGDGPDRQALEERYAQLPGVTWHGRLSRPEVMAHIAASRFLVFPSLACENCPMVLLEALAVATPVVAAGHPSVGTMIRHQREGLLFPPGDLPAFVEALRDALLAESSTWARWSSAARRTQVERYSEDLSYGRLMSIYQSVMRNQLVPALALETTPCES
jgi:glycosyltransferase involved in cell wall biosynthesis